jgi:hypothetical protein
MLACSLVLVLKACEPRYVLCSAAVLLSTCTIISAAIHQPQTVFAWPAPLASRPPGHLPAQASFTSSGVWAVAGCLKGHAPLGDPS